MENEPEKSALQDAPPTQPGGAANEWGMICCSPGWLLSILLALIVLPAVFVFRHGYRSATIAPGIENALGNGIGGALMLVQVLLALSAVNRCLRAGSSWRLTENGPVLIFLILLLEPLQLAMIHNGAYCYGVCVNLSKLGRARADLRDLGRALDQYAVDHGGYPASLRSLATAPRAAQDRSYFSGLPRPKFADEPEPRYAVYTRPGAQKATFWMLWQPGVTRRWSVDPGPELQAELALLDQGQPPSPWLMDRIYDPTNGSLAKASINGDIVLWKR